MAARAWTVAALFLPILLFVAVVYAHRARREAALSAGAFSWPQRPIDRPVVFYVLLWLAFFTAMFVLMGVLSVLGVSPL